MKDGSHFKKLFYWVVRKTRRYVWIIAEAYDLKIQRAGYPYGQYPVEIADREEALRHRIPKSVYFNTRSGRILIEKNVVFGEDVKVLTGKHMNIKEAASEEVELHHVPEGGRDIVIREGSYIGSGAIIIGPVEIGRYAVIGAGAVVTKDVPERVFVAGTPAKQVARLSA